MDTIICTNCRGSGESQQVDYNGETPYLTNIRCQKCLGSGQVLTTVLSDQLKDKNEKN
jgi:DnaJ-class molecular chaperone